MEEPEVEAAEVVEGSAGSNEEMKARGWFFLLLILAAIVLLFYRVYPAHHPLEA